MRRFARFLLRSAVGVIAALLALLLGLRVAAWWQEDDHSVPPTTTLIATPLGTVAATIAGPRDGRPVLLVHGTAGWSGFWRETTAHLAARGWRVIAVDLPPFGYSAHDPQARYDRVSQAARLSAVLAHEAPVAAAVVVGHSFGAGAATELALSDPRRVRRLVLVDAAFGELDPPPHATSLPERALRFAPLAELATSATITDRWATGALLRGLLARKDAADRWLATLRRPMRRPGTTAAYARWLPALFAADDGGMSRHSARLAAIRPSVAIIWGAADTVTPIAQGERLARLMRVRSFERIDGVGHIPHIEAPAAFMAALDRALDPQSQREDGR